MVRILIFECIFFNLIIEIFLFFMIIFFFLGMLFVILYIEDNKLGFNFVDEFLVFK